MIDSHLHLMPLSQTLISMSLDATKMEVRSLGVTAKVEDVS